MNNISEQSQKQKLRNGNVPWVESFPNNSQITWFSGHCIHAEAPGPSGKLWNKSFPISICDNRKYGEHSNAVKRQGKYFYLHFLGQNIGYIWK